MLKMSDILAQSPGDEYELTPVEPSIETGIENSGDKFQSDAESAPPEVPSSDVSIESDNASISPQVAPSEENRFVREDPW